jgi:hypothetical protein
MISPKSPGWNGDIQNTVRCGSGVIVLPSENKRGCWISSTNVPCDRSRQPCLVTVRLGLGPHATIGVFGGRGMDCYVLCATLHNTEDVRRQFGASDSCIAIDDILGFANAVSLKIPYFTSGFEGPVIYQDDTTVKKNIGAMKAEELIERYKNPDGTVRMDMIREVAQMTGGIEEYFVKHSQHARECEYRLLWATSENVEPFIDIKVPKAIRFCRHVTVCRQSISDSWLGNLRECLAHLV